MESYDRDDTKMTPSAWSHAYAAVGLGTWIEWTGTRFTRASATSIVTSESVVMRRVPEKNAHRQSVGCSLSRAMR